MSLRRAFTLRRTKVTEMTTTSPMGIGRAASQRGGRPVTRVLISSPVELTSSTNVLSYNAPDIVGTTPVAVRDAPGISSNSSVSGEDSDFSTPNGSIRDSSTDASSIDEDPKSPTENHLSCYFKPNVETSSPSVSRRTSLSMHPPNNAPDVPQRAPSHSKRAHERLHSRRSVQRLIAAPLASREIRSSAEILGALEGSSGKANSAVFVEAPIRENPFGNELAQLDEVAEEFGCSIRDAEAAADAVYLETRGLACYGASEYLNDIQDLVCDQFAGDREDVAVPDFAAWI